MGYGDRAAWCPPSGLQCGFLAGDGRERLTNVHTLERNPEQLLFSAGEQPSLTFKAAVPSEAEEIRLPIQAREEKHVQSFVSSVSPVVVLVQLNGTGAQQACQASGQEQNNGLISSVRGRGKAQMVRIYSQLSS